MNPRDPCRSASFQDWCHQPLGHLTAKPTIRQQKTPLGLPAGFLMGDLFAYLFAQPDASPDEDDELDELETNVNMVLFISGRMLWCQVLSSW